MCWAHGQLNVAQSDLRGTPAAIAEVTNKIQEHRLRMANLAAKELSKGSAADYDYIDRLRAYAAHPEVDTQAQDHWDDLGPTVFRPIIGLFTHVLPEALGDRYASFRKGMRKTLTSFLEFDRMVNALFQYQNNPNVDLTSLGIPEGTVTVESGYCETTPGSWEKIL
jgi:hypothetical protein